MKAGLHLGNLKFWFNKEKQKFFFFANVNWVKCSKARFSWKSIFYMLMHIWDECNAQDEERGYVRLREAVVVLRVERYLVGRGSGKQSMGVTNSESFLNKWFSNGKTHLSWPFCLFLLHTLNIKLIS